MMESISFTRGADWLRWLVPTLGTAAGLCLICWRLLPRAAVWMGFMLFLSAAVAAQIMRQWPTPGGGVQDVAQVCAVLTLVWVACAAALLRGSVPRAWKAWGTRGPASQRTGHASLAWGTNVVALLLGVVTAIIQSVVLVMRVIYVTVDLLNGYPYRGTRDYGFDIAGLWSIGFLLAACVIALASTGERRLVTCQLWCATIMASWACLLSPALQSTGTGRYERTGSTLLLLAVLSVLSAAAVIITGLADRQRRVGDLSMWDRLSSRSKDRLESLSHMMASSLRADGMSGRSADMLANSRACHPWPGLSFSVAMTSLAVIMLGSFHLAVPIALSRGGFRLAVLTVTGSTAIAAIASFVLVARSWNGHLADAAMALTSLSLCGLATLAVPSHPSALVERYPMVFNAMVVGLAGGTFLWTWLASVWQRQLDGGGQSADETCRSTTCARLIPHATRFAFLGAVLALVAGMVMAVWPRWRAIATTDDSFGRVTAGVSANLFLLLVMLWSSRRSHRPVFQILTVLAVVSMAGFLLVRMLPFTPRFG